MHVLVAVGSMEEWQSVSETEWSTLLNRWIEPLVPTARVRSARPSTLTVAPYAASGVASLDLRRILVGQIGAKDSEMCLAGSLRGVPVRIDLIGSGLERLAATGRGLVAARTDIDEDSIDEFMFGEIGEPDLVVACGPQSQSAPSLVWELAYSEIVYVDIPWRELSSAHLDYAIRDYHNRNRRFGGV